MKTHFALIAAILLGVCGSTTGFSSAFAADRQVSVTGACHRMTTPDRGAVTLTAEYQEKDLKVATERASTAYERVKAAIQKLGLQNLELKTVEYSLMEVKEWEKDRQVMKGYRARLGLNVSTSDIQRLGEVMAIASREGIRNVGGLTTYLSEQKLLSEHFACLQTAAENARAKAEKLAGALKARVGETVSITENYQGFNPTPPEPPIGIMNMKASREMAPPGIEAGQQSLTLSVNAVFELK